MSKFCQCGHSWFMHRAAANGAHACTYFGCGCRDTVEPPKALWMVTFMADREADGLPRQLPVYAHDFYEAVKLVADWPYGHRVIGVTLDE